ncbi:cupin domain-containing protein [Halopenitus sp. H-Gu1]|uniref:cupin domain-containing protein n=1 Tax=Halopenitus sp. H-Gu1 TaxID=3242697 RepID=UPI00359D2032
MQKINDTDLCWEEYDHGEQFFRRKQLSEAVDADDVGCSLYELPPGKRSWPYHYHTANEEALYVLAGTGQLRGEDQTVQLERGDYVTLPADTSGGHQVVNDRDAPLRYLMVSTMNEPDVTVYPELEKFGVFVDAPPGDSGDRSFHGFYNIDDDVDYWENEGE